MGKIENNLQHLKLLFFVTEDWYFCSHRLPLALAAKEFGYEVSVVTNVNCHGEAIKRSGIKLIPLELSRRGINPLRELLLIYRLALIYRKEQPTIAHHVALKPILYGSIASWVAKVPFKVNAMAGLGFLFSSKTLKARAIRPFILFFFRFLLNLKGSRVILQNPDDVDLLSTSGVLERERIVLIRGSGVDIEEFKVQPEPSGDLIVVLASRLLWDKGVGEFVEAARQLKQQGVCARFVLVGEGDPENPTAISRDQLRAWHEEGVVEWWGRRDDMATVLAKTHIVCLPSYREGLPKVLLEAAACGRPIVTTDTPGCREIVHDDLNGFLVPIRDANAVAAALKKLLASSKLRQTMGMHGRELVEREFTLEKVNLQTLALYEKLIK
ncbi:MAG TPA: glycosyltransferase family 1 protein [Desulfobulbaceae bacterium]|nr:glycosyltransferase family 1 protein [Desulfobulbaceae bacterium]